MAWWCRHGPPPGAEKRRSRCPERSSTTPAQACRRSWHLRSTPCERPRSACSLLARDLRPGRAREGPSSEVSGIGRQAPELPDSSWLQRLSDWRAAEPEQLADAEVHGNSTGDRRARWPKAGGSSKARRARWRQPRLAELERARAAAQYDIETRCRDDFLQRFLRNKAPGRWLLPNHTESSQYRRAGCMNTAKPRLSGCAVARVAIRAALLH